MADYADSPGEGPLRWADDRGDGKPGWRTDDGWYDLGELRRNVPDVTYSSETLVRYFIPGLGAVVPWPGPWRTRDTFQDQNPGHKRTQRAPRRLS